ncbi:MAG: DNA polymerase III subunit delta' [Alphaproteobacteria bacterium]|nr:DNA polymerase III subunit delta' [Alphaproteobacteria bacterium]
MPDFDVITPKNNTFLLGQEDAEKAVLEAYNNHKLHNSWLISGEKGIGKATFAYKFARFLLDENRSFNSLNTNPESPSNRLISSSSHPDLKVIERDYIETDRKKILKSIKDGEAMSESERQGLKKSAFIRIDDVRTINEFMSKKSSHNGWKVVIIDSIDDMNTASANALLKILEEPPTKSILLLISHNIGRLLPTIKSRCAKLSLKPLSNSDVAVLLRRYRPNLEESDIKSLAGIAAGSIGRALMFADNGALGVYSGLKKLASSGIHFRLDDMLDWTAKAVQSDESYFLAQELIMRFFADMIITAPDVEECALAWEKAMHSFRVTESLNLDRRQTLINIITQLCKMNQR